MPYYLIILCSLSGFDQVCFGYGLALFAFAEVCFDLTLYADLLSVISFELSKTITLLCCRL